MHRLARCGGAAVTAGTWPQDDGALRPAGGGRHRRPEPVAPHPSWRLLGRGGSGQPAMPMAGRAAACIACVGVALVVIKETARFRGLEAQLAAHVAGLVSAGPSGSVPSLAEYWFAASRTQLIGLQITSECTVALLTVPFLLGTAGLVWIRSSVARPLGALCAAVVLLITLNQLRFLLIDVLIRIMGFQSGFYWGHRWLGSIITVVGTTAIIGVFALLVSGAGGKSSAPGRTHT